MNANFVCPNCGFTGAQMQAELERKDKIGALLRERHYLEQRGEDERVALVDEQLGLLGHEGAPPRKRAERRSRASVAGMDAMRRGGL